MQFEDVKDGMLVKYYDYEYKRYFVAEVIGTEWGIDEQNNEFPCVLLDDPMIPGRIISISPVHLEPYITKRERLTHCWNCKMNLSSRTMPLCDKCNGIECPRCKGCLCSYNR